ncbi:glycosyltransferase family 2 protein [Rhodococcus sp. TAF43]|uniref:glycosyltransferase n=1 Tax=unclassified Rhodococcus (in: high G+C Gram-positive bacteria) TaxID=192944 RepID=UPI000E0AC2D4|nr:MULTISPECIES: glycosyltransferase family 2 protein [unclassified Rhodococcus (in: high G+C Gram-positive bacteria)]QKT11303.1 glycosyltransferase family 2 protein [Rhodococcus sp. W8901]RDI31583.1 glycosyl transferase family 2 [Rhodococcus sp. AG1013]
MTTAATLSVVVPAYNEENYIGACLEALLVQQADLHEIVVVDNNSTDRTVEIVESFAAEHPVVRVIREATPGTVYARNAGFEAATGDVVGRIDADTRVEPHWARTVLEFFDREDAAAVGAVSGIDDSYDSPYRALKRWYVDRLVRRGRFGGEQRIANLYGANMALRKSTWEKVRDASSSELDVHEDVDLALCIVQAGVEIAQLSDMRVAISPRRALTPPHEFVRYVTAGANTYSRHDLMSARIRILLGVQWIAHAGAYLAYRPYDPDRGRFTLRRLMFGGGARTMPVA